MITLNLLPWRERMRERRKRNFLLGLAGAAALGIIISGIIVGALQQRLSSQEDRNAYLQAQVIKINKQIQEVVLLKKEKKQLLKRLAIIQRLQSDRPMVVHLFDSLPRVTPGGIYFVEWRRVGDRLEFSGRSEANADISTLMRNLEQDEWFKNPVLREIKQPNTEGNFSRFSDFILTAFLPDTQSETLKSGEEGK